MIAEFENAVRCTSYQHPQMQQPLYMMSAGAGKMNMWYSYVGFHVSGG